MTTQKIPPSPPQPTRGIPGAFVPILCPQCGYVWNDLEFTAMGRKHCPSCIACFGEYIVGIRVIQE